MRTTAILMTILVSAISGCSKHTEPPDATSVSTLLRQGSPQACTHPAVIAKLSESLLPDETWPRGNQAQNFPNLKGVVESASVLEIRKDEQSVRCEAILAIHSGQKSVSGSGVELSYELRPDLVRPGEFVIQADSYRASSTLRMMLQAYGILR